MSAALDRIMATVETAVRNMQEVPLTHNGLDGVYWSGGDCLNLVFTVAATHQVLVVVVTSWAFMGRRWYSLTTGTLHVVREGHAAALAEWRRGMVERYGPVIP